MIGMKGKLWSLALYLFVLGFILNLLGIVSTCKQLRAAIGREGSSNFLKTIES